jgi:hypothetical protein
MRNRLIPKLCARHISAKFLSDEASISSRTVQTATVLLEKAIVI